MFQIWKKYLEFREMNLKKTSKLAYLSSALKLVFSL